MTKPTPSQVDAARGLLAREARDGESAEARAAAGRRVFDKVIAHLGKLIGAAAARALFERSVKLVTPGRPRLGQGGPFGGNLGEHVESCLLGASVDEIDESLVAIFAMLFALLSTMSGERLTEKVLRESWPAAGAGGSKEKTK